MVSEPVATTEHAGQRSLSAEWRLAGIGFAVTAIFLGSMWAASWWAVRAQGTSLEDARAVQVTSTGNTLARTAEVMLAGNELSAIRRILSETARDAGFTRCRIVLPDGGVVADATPSGITVRELPATWAGARPSPDVGAGPEVRSFPIQVPERGSARLEIEAPVKPLGVTNWQAQSGMAAICVVALVLLMALYRGVTSGLRGVWAVRQALLARLNGQTALAALEVNPDWGSEARAWNELLNHEDRRQKESALTNTRDQIQARTGYCDNLSSACDALSQGLILLDHNMHATYVNSAAAVLLQKNREEMLTVDIAVLVTDERVLAAAKAATGGPIQRRTIVEVQRKDAGAELLRFIVRPVRREDAGVAMIIIEDITQQRVAEEARNAFVAQATHELRTPLTNIRLYTEMALDDGKDDPKVMATCLNVINQETFRLDRIVGDILSIAEIEAGTMGLKRDDVRLDEVFPELQTDYAAQAQEKQITLQFRLPPKLPVITGDREKIRLALHNLVGNALKYTPTGGTVTVNVSADQGRLLVDVTDTGIGMNDEDRQHIFEKFYRAKDRRVGKITGSGLGLTIAREVIRLHGGDITVESELDKGSTFSLTLPITEAA